MWSWFDILIHRHMLVEFVGSLICSESFFPGHSGFHPSSKKPTFNLIISVYSVPNWCSSARTTRHLNKVSLLFYSANIGRWNLVRMQTMLIVDNFPLCRGAPSKTHVFPSLLSTRSQQWIVWFNGAFQK